MTPATAGVASPAFYAFSLFVALLAVLALALLRPVGAAPLLLVLVLALLLAFSFGTHRIDFHRCRCLLVGWRCRRACRPDSRRLDIALDDSLGLSIALADGLRLQMQMLTNICRCSSRHDCDQHRFWESFSSCAAVSLYVLLPENQLLLPLAELAGPRRVEHLVQQTHRPCCGLRLVEDRQLAVGFVAVGVPLLVHALQNMKGSSFAQEHQHMVQLAAPSIHCGIVGRGDRRCLRCEFHLASHLRAEHANPAQEHKVP